MESFTVIAALDLGIALVVWAVAAQLVVGWWLIGVVRRLHAADGASGARAEVEARLEQEVTAAQAVAERERRIAQTLQRSLLPAQLPDLPSLELAAQYLPGGEGDEVGGDWYDVIPLRDGDVVLVMGDVVGRGIPAAALVGKLRNALRAYVVEGHPPEDALERLNHLVDRPAQEMATVLVARFRPSSGALRWASAGHLPALLRRADGSSLFLEGGRSVPLGALAHVAFEADETTLAPGDTLMLFTDGLVERRGVPLDESLEQLRLVAPVGGDAAVLCDAIVDALLPEGTEADDVAVLTARVRVPVVAAEAVGAGLAP
jgi:serine phosphatase RsbU (regulator of sigma subunit)